MTARKAKRARRSFLGRLVEGVADALLLVIIAAFAISIATRAGRHPANAGERSGSSSRPEAGSGHDPAARSEAGGHRSGDPGSLPAKTGKQAEPGTRTEAQKAARPPEDLRSRPTVDVRNGCRRVRLAEDMARWMREAREFDVLEYRNADRQDYAKTLIKNRGTSSGKAGAERVRDWLRDRYGVGELQTDPGLTTAAEVLVVLGSDLADTLRRRERRENLAPGTEQAE